VAVDIRSGAGNDCFVASVIVSDTGKVTGLECTDEMMQKADYLNVIRSRGELSDFWDSLNRGTTNISISIGLILIIFIHFIFLTCLQDCFLKVINSCR
jgi:hypothetical protein